MPTLILFQGQQRGIDLARNCTVLSQGVDISAREGTLTCQTSSTTGDVCTCSEIKLGASYSPFDIQTGKSRHFQASKENQTTWKLYQRFVASFCPGGFCSLESTNIFHVFMWLESFVFLPLVPLPAFPEFSALFRNIVISSLWLLYSSVSSYSVKCTTASH